MPPPSNFSKMQSFMQNKKTSKSDTKNAFYSGIFEMQFWKTIVIFEINTLQFFKMHGLLQKLKSLNLGPKMSYLGIFRLKFEKKSYCIFEISNFELVKMQKFVQNFQTSIFFS